jgi:hypothetical protein
MAAITALLVLLARWGLEPLSPFATPLYAVPPFFLGLYLVIGAMWIRDLGLYGAVATRLPPSAHAGLLGLGFGLVGLALWILLALPPAGAAGIARALPTFEGRCQGTPGVRVERELLPTVEAVLRDRDRQSASLRARVDGTLRTLMTRCGEQARVAFSDPRGTHSSWRRLREWLEAHPELHDLPPGDPLWQLPWNERLAEPRLEGIPVPVELER